MNIEQSILTIGTVVDTNDPQQMGRLRVSCPKWGDTDNTLVVDIPWASYVTPFGGILTRGTRGPEDQTTNGPVAYGMWAIPKVGSSVVCMLLDGDPNHRVWMGSIHASHMPHTLPMGRYLDDGTTGPVSSTEQPIEPLSSNMQEAFGDASGNHERLTRGAENQAASIKNTIIEKTVSTRDDYREDADNRTGYQKSRIVGDLPFAETDGNFDPQTYSLTTPGMHSFIMDDSLKNGKIRIRSTSGNQIILDDTNERIYISTAEGKNYIEMDRAGNVEIHSDRRVSIHAKKDINFTTEETFRVSAKSIHMRSSEDMRFHADTDFSVLADEAVRLQANAGPIEIQSGTNLKIQTTTTLDITSTTGPINIFSGGSLILGTSGALSMSSGSGGGSGDFEMAISGKIQMVADEFHVNTTIASGTTSPGPIRFSSGGSIDFTTDPNFDINFDSGGTGVLNFNSGVSTTADIADPDPADEADLPDVGLGGTIGNEGLYAYTTSRVPIHEPWGRISNNPDETDQNTSVNLMSAVLNMTTNSSTLELTYNDANANKIDLGDNLSRNNNWHR